MMTTNEMLQTDINVSCFAIEKIIKDKIDILTHHIRRVEERNDNETAKRITRDAYIKKDTLQDLLSNIIKYRLNLITKEEYDKQNKR